AAPLRSDVGPAVALAGVYVAPRDDTYRLSVGGSGSFQSIHPRRGYTINVHASGGGSFEEANLETRLRYGGARRDVYQAASFLNRGLPTDILSETIEATSSDTLAVGVGLAAPLLPGLRLTGRVDGTVMRRFIRTHRAPDETLYFDTDLNRRAVDLAVGLNYAGAGRSAEVSFEVNADAEDRRIANRDRLPATQATQKSGVLQQADFERSIVTLRGRGETTLGPRANVRIESMLSIMRRDTPQINVDDRDESFANVTAALSYRWSDYLETDLSIFGSRFHTVYLSGARSAENNVQQSLRLRPSIRWQPDDATRMELRSEVRATYTVDDFQLPDRRPNDQSAREMRFDLDFDRELGGGIRLLTEAGHTDLRLGRLLWDSFAEIPFDTLRTYNGWFRIQAGRRFVSELGIRFFLRSDFSRSIGIRYPAADGEPAQALINRPGREWINQIGPTAALTAHLGTSSEIRLDGWLTMQRIHYSLYGSLPPERAAAIRRSARDGSSLIIPNLSLSARWAF
ncbi:MAG: hypothetical protein ACOCTG_03990, partial [Bacteroidota bacterium]